ncbi:MAG: DNA polymerase Y family protein [Pseudoalteromonas distincta]
MLTNIHDGLAVAQSDALRQVLEQLPVARAGFDPDVARALSRMGLHRLHQVLALPRAGLAKRFPEEVLHHLDMLLGLRAQALECYAPADFFDVRIELNFDVGSHQALLFPLRRLTSDLAAFLAGRDSGVQRFVLHLEHREGEDSLVSVGLLSAERDAAMLFELARGRLEQLQVRAPVQALRLLARDLPAFVPQERELFEARPQQILPWEQLRERLRARLGDDAVAALSVRPDHRPEQAWRTSEVRAPFLLNDSSSARPGWLLQEPQTQLSSLRVLAGPERIESGWWDGGDMRRDYYLVETRSGQRGWAYRPVGQGGPLWLHGWFA